MRILSVNLPSPAFRWSCIYYTEPYFNCVHNPAKSKNFWSNSQTSKVIVRRKAFLFTESLVLSIYIFQSTKPYNSIFIGKWNRRYRLAIMKAVCSQWTTALCSKCCSFWKHVKIRHLITHVFWTNSLHNISRVFEINHSVRWCGFLQTIVVL